MTPGEAKSDVAARVDALAGELVAVSRSLHESAEVAYEEVRARAVLVDALERHGVRLASMQSALDTAFVAEIGSSGPVVGILCEYDALPELGHACGHNVIAAAGLGAALALQNVAEPLGGRVRVLGTPAEEGGGGKVYMLREGLFDGLSSVMMVHPADRDAPSMTLGSLGQLRVEFHGRAAHAAVSPQLGRNALDAAVLSYQAAAALRQHLGPRERIHGTFIDGGGRPNVVPAFASMLWYVRSPTLSGLEDLQNRLLACMDAGAAATGCTVKVERLDPTYADLVTNGPLLDAFACNFRELGRSMSDPETAEGGAGSTDFGNVSHASPSIHPLIAICDPGISLHSAAFAAAAASPRADTALLDAAKAMAMTVVDIWTSAELRGAMARDHKASTSDVAGPLGEVGRSSSS